MPARVYYPFFFLFDVKRYIFISTVVIYKVVYTKIVLFAFNVQVKKG